MAGFKVLLTDYAWANLDIERETLAKAGAELIVAQATDADSLAKLAVEADAIMTNWAKVTGPVIAAAPKCRIVADWASVWITSTCRSPASAACS